MKTASELFKEFLPSVRTPPKAAALFAADGVLELPYLADLGMPWQYRGREEIAGLYARLLGLVPDWEFREAVVLIDTPDKLFAEYKVDAFAVATGRPFKQHFFGYMLVDAGEIKRLREALNIVATARAFLPGGLADLAPVPAADDERLGRELEPDVDVTRILIQHVHARSEKPFGEVAAAFEARLGVFDPAVYEQLQNGADPGAVKDRLERMVGPSGFMLFRTSDHGALLRLDGQATKAVQYLVGNPLFAVRMTRYDVRAGLYAPLRVLLYEDGDGKTCVEYDRPSSLFGQFGDANVTEVAAMLDRKLEQLVAAAIR
jgi:uncharacterized protein (DUF302 family)